MGIDSKLEDRVLTLTLNAPESMNALAIEDLLALRAALERAQDNDDVRAIVLTGAGERAFCAGANMKALARPGLSFASNSLGSRAKEAAAGGYTRLIDLGDLNLWKPLVAAINGHCLGGGLELALQCDLRVAAEHASFGLPEVKVGSVPAVGGVQYLLRSVPAAHAMKMALTGDRIDALEAWRIGLVSDMVPMAELSLVAHRIAASIAANGPLAVQVVKRLAVETAHLAPRDFVNLSNVQWGLLRDSLDRQEGRNAFAERRSPKFTGR